jgi:SNW domain-containing protein 1
MGLLAALPAPTRELKAPEAPIPSPSITAKAIQEPPPYGQRQGFIPRKPEDFGDGEHCSFRAEYHTQNRLFTSRLVPFHRMLAYSFCGSSPYFQGLTLSLSRTGVHIDPSISTNADTAGGAYPEIHLAQYPLNMGRPDKRGAGGAAGAGRASQTLALTVDAEGNVNYDAIVKQGGHSNALVATNHKALVPKLEQLNAKMPKPDEQAIEETTKATAAALEARVLKKQAVMNPKAVAAAPGAAEYIKYTSASSSAAHASGASTRIIKMQNMPVDPLEPPKFRHVKVPRGSGSPPVPVMHSPPRALTTQDRQDWKIPPCISNWKNAKGYTIPLDKRLAADGRGLQEVQVNDQFAKFSEALYIAEQTARSAVETRAKMQRELLAREKERKEEELRELAAKARQDRMGGRVVSAREAADSVAAGSVGRGRAASPPSPAAAATARAGGPASSEDRNVRRPASAGEPPSDDEREIPEAYRTRNERRRGLDEDAEETRAEREERRRRDELREERRRERERERRLDARDARGYKRSKLTRDKDRDISEKVALGMAKVSGGGEAMYDQRLFNQDTGLDTGMGAEDAYNLYDKPLFTDRSELFKARGGAGGGGDVDTTKFKPDKGFTGADYTRSGREAASERHGDGVAFEQDPAEADPFGLNAFLTDSGDGKGKAGGRKDPLGGIGRKGGMAAGGGAAGKYEDYAGGGSGRRMDFVSGQR